MQRLAGNAAVAQLVGEERLTVQRDSDDRGVKVDAALNASPPDTSLVKAIKDFKGLPHQTVAKLARILINNYEVFFGPNDRDTLTNLLEGFGAEVEDFEKYEPFAFETAMKKWPGLMVSNAWIGAAADAPSSAGS